ncbi:MAG TPA: CapA family protein [Thermoflexia bacterium]|nr:CapA family protein [Thermoflexia bacterium]
MQKRNLAILFGLLLSLLLGACAIPTIQPTPTPTRTPKPTLTPTPSSTPTPSPTPTPAFPVTVGCQPFIPAGACATLREEIAAKPTYFSWIDDPVSADLVLGGADTPHNQVIGSWTYLLVAPFMTTPDAISLAALQNSWAGTAAETCVPLFLTAETRRALVTLWGPPSSENVQALAAAELLTATQIAGGWAIIPFEELHPRWKVLQIEGYSPVEKGALPATYPLTIPFYLGSAGRPEMLKIADLNATSISNRTAENLTVVVMTGVTAMTRGMAQLMDAKGVTYPAQDIKPWFEEADFVHISNEVSFKPDCVACGHGCMSFCSHDSYIGLLEEIHANIIELTGNHLEDQGSSWVDHSLAMYQERGWQWFGGGTNQEEGSQPLLVEDGPNKIAFLGCNTVGPFAGEDSGGAAHCGDFEELRVNITTVRAAGYLPIVSIQHQEAYEYMPSARQLRDFRSLAAAGAVMVQGSQAHQPQTLEFYGDTFIHYGLGNFFFDQMWSLGTRQEFVDQLTFYEGQLININLHTALLEEFGRPRPMSAEEREGFLQMIFALSPNQN